MQQDMVSCNTRSFVEYVASKPIICSTTVHKNTNRWELVGVQKIPCAHKSTDTALFCRVLYRLREYAQLCCSLLFRTGRDKWLPWQRVWRTTQYAVLLTPTRQLVSTGTGSDSSTGRRIRDTVYDFFFSFFAEIILSPSLKWFYDEGYEYYETTSMILRRLTPL
jgi:hypothetical protein